MRFDRDLPESLMDTGFAPRWGAVGSAEKVAHRLGEVPQRLLLHRLRPSRQPIMLGTDRSQLSALLVIARRAPTGLPMPPLLDGEIPHIPRVTAMLRQRHRLFSGRKQPVTRHTGNVTATTDKSPKGEAAPLPSARSQGVSTPQGSDEGH
jgi:hypothetical protein